MTSPDSAVVVDARGLRCPAPVIRLARAARDVPAGTELTVLATDPAAVHDVPAWARMRGHELVSATEDDGVHAITVRTR
ncbi:sulfurtransferase TusA family protein [Cellulomonas sp.]|uniref:sulfurtransferase TusA family protein n=1 Tax=Cellulomonas sp. TaxID=40001 RepID=UPI001B2A31C0|nr:sulfurtransferase TusA family protein [Cellulomonas sp.]MBO9554024.1 sulfurtransferase TusA family protein [Cellulomonas sp.]